MQASRTLWFAYVCLGLLSVTPLLAFSQEVKESPRGNVTTSTSTTKTVNDSLGISRETIPDISLLFAKNLSTADKKQISDYAAAMNESVGYSSTATLEDLMNPAAELYGEDSWTSTVDPFGSRSVKVPNNYSINVKDFAYPLDGIRRVNSQYGYRRRFRRMHYGVDLQLHVGDTVRSCFDGKVRIVAFNRGGYGKYVVVRHTNGLETVYGHLSRQTVKEGDIVHSGDPIGLGGNTGRSTGPHLHLEMRFLGIAINPAAIIDFGNGVPVSENYVYNSRNYKRSAKQTQYLASRSTKNKGSKSSGSSVDIYRVRKGDTLAKIAKKYGTTVTKLKKLNGMRSSKLSIGRTLRVSA